MRRVEDVVAGIRTPMKLIEMDKKYPAAYKQLCDVRAKLEKHFKEMQDLEFTVEDEKLYMLQCRTGKRSPQATFVMAAEMVKEKLISKEDAIRRISARRHRTPLLSSHRFENFEGRIGPEKIDDGHQRRPGISVGRSSFQCG